MSDTIWCAMCGKYTDHGSGSCPELGHDRSLGPVAGSARRPKVKGWWEEYRCGCISDTVAKKKDLVGYCGRHGESRRQTFPELETEKAPNA